MDLLRQDRPFWKEYLIGAEQLLTTGVPLPSATVLAVLNGSLEVKKRKEIKDEKKKEKIKTKK